MNLSAGARLGVFEIVAPLGAGGMGEVYRARDTRLGRDVAIKILPPLFAADPDRRARFDREARALAALNHPHIAAIHGVEEADGIAALVLEYVDGETLAARLRRGAIGVPEATRIAVDIAAAVEAAHDRGIVHRDLKPANVKLASDGTVKVLDFGLAKAITDDAPAADLTQSPTVSAVGTRAGVLLGTAAYMSPEQARGLPVNAQSDVWSFGCLLYEMLTARPAFRGATVTDILAAVITTEPDWQALPDDVPGDLVRLLKRCLQKDAKNRLRHIGDARLLLEEPRGPAIVAAAPGRPRVSLGLAIGLAVAAAAVGGFLLATQWSPQRRDVMNAVSVQRVTYDAGLTTMPSISGDGRLLAYASDRAGRGDLDIWVQLDDAPPVRVTSDSEDEETPHIAPDGRQIAFRSERAGGGIYLVPTFGGEPRLIVPEGRGPRFSPDGSRIAYWTGGFRGGSLAISATYVVALAGGDPIRVLADFETARDPVWASDGRGLLVSGVARRSDGRERLDWWWVPLDGGQAVATNAARFAPVAAAIRATERAEWVGDELVFSDGHDLWTLPLATNRGVVADAPQRLTVGAQDYNHPSAGRDGSIVFASTVRRRVIARASLSESTGSAPVLLYEDGRAEAGRASQTADGSRIVFERDVPEGREIWMRSVADASERLIARVPERRLLNATVSPDGSRVAYSADESGYVVDTSRGVPTQFCSGCGLWGFLSDSRRVLAGTGAAGGGQTLRLIDVATRAAHVVVEVSEGTLNRPHVSPDDRWVAYRHETPDGSKTYLAPLSTTRPATIGTSVQIDEPTTTGRPCGWALDSRTLYLLLDSDGWRCLYGQRVDTAGRPVGTPAAARHFHGREGSFGTSMGNAIGPHGLLMEALRPTANLWILRRPPITVAGDAAASPR